MGKVKDSKIKPCDLSRVPAALAELVSPTPSNEGIHAAQSYLVGCARDPGFLGVLAAGLFSGETAAAVRHVSAVLLRKRISALWGLCDGGLHAGVKTGLLACLGNKDEVPAVRRSVCFLVVSVGKVELRAGRWPELLPFLAQCANPATPTLFASALLVFSGLTEAIPEFMQPLSAGFVPVLAGGLTHDSDVVRSAAVRALGTIIGVFDGDSLDLFTPLVPGIMAVMEKALGAGEEELACEAAEVISTLLEGESAAMIEHLPGILNAGLVVSVGKNFAITTRSAFSMLVVGILRFRATAFKKLGHGIPSVVRAAMQCCAEPPVYASSDSGGGGGGDDDDDDEDDGEMEAFHIGTQLLGTLAEEMPVKRVYPAVMADVQTCLASGDPLNARAALIAIASIADACHEPLLGGLSQLVPVIVQAGGAGNVHLRDAAVLCMTTLSQELIPDIQAYHASVIPFIFERLADPSPVIVKRACVALEAFCENLTTEILPFLHGLMVKLSGLLASPSAEVQDLALGAIGSTITASGTAAEPYLPDIMRTVKGLLARDDDAALKVRARSMEVLGAVAINLGKERFAPEVPSLMERALQGMMLDYGPLREHTLSFFTNIVTVLEEDSKPYLEGIVAHCFNSLESEDIIEQDGGEDDGVAGGIDFNLHESDDDDEDRGTGGNDGDDDGEEEEEEELEPGANLLVRTSLLDEKATAMSCLGLIALNAGKAFLPYIEPSFELMAQALNYFHADVRANSAEAIGHLAVSLIRSYPPPAGSAPGQVHELVSGCCKTTFHSLLISMRKDDDRQVVGRAGEALARIIQEAGPGVVDEGLVAKIQDIVIKILRRKTLCQRRGAEEADANDDLNDDDHDELVIDAASDLIIALAKVLRGNFQGLFRPYFEVLVRFMAPARPSGDRLMAVGTVAQVCQEIKESFAPYTATFAPIAISLLSDESTGVQRNAAFAMCSVVEHSGAAAFPYYMPTLAAIAPLFGRPPPVLDEEKGLRDNITSCLARITVQMTTIEAARAHAPPLETYYAQIIPSFLGALPLLSDFDENDSVYSCLAMLMSSKPCPLAGDARPRAIEIVQLVQGLESVPDKIKAYLRDAAQHLQ